jgi:hypothetical protein
MRGSPRHEQADPMANPIIVIGCVIHLEVWAERPSQESASSSRAHGKLLTGADCMKSSLITRFGKDAYGSVPGRGLRS